MKKDKTLLLSIAALVATAANFILDYIIYISR